MDCGEMKELVRKGIYKHIAYGIMKSLNLLYIMINWPGISGTDFNIPETLAIFPFLQHPLTSLLPLCHVR